MRRYFYQHTLMIFLGLLCTNRSFAQEISLDAIPTAMQKSVPDAVMYRFFLQHNASFERRARAANTQNQSENAFRKHLTKKFSITSLEQQKIAEIALAFDDQLNQLRAQAVQVAEPFWNQQFPNGKHLKGQPLPMLPPELKEIRKNINALSLKSRDQLRVSLGEARFNQLDSVLRGHVNHDVIVFNPTLNK